MASPEDRLMPGSGSGTGVAALRRPSRWWRSGRELVTEVRRYLPLVGLPAAQRRARVMTAAAALAVGLFLAAVPMTAGGDLAPLQAVAGVAGMAALLACVAGWPAGIGWSVALLAADYGMTLAGRSRLDPAAPLEAAGLLLMAELAAWSLECRTRAPDGPGVLAWRLRRLALVEVVALMCGVAVLAVANLPAHGGTTLGAIGVASAVAVLVLAAVVLHRLRRATAGAA
jgi:hypothetical protein